MNDGVPGGERAVTRALTTGFVSVALLAVFVCVVLMVMLVRVGNELEESRHDGLAAQRGLGLALAVREHYVHEAHAVLAHRHSSARATHQQDDHATWLAELRTAISELEPNVPLGARGRLEHLSAVCDELDDVFLQGVLPAASRGDTEALGRFHAEAQRLTAEATEDADQVVAALNERMAQTRRRVQKATTVALVAGCVGIVAILLLTMVFAARIRSVILLPMQTLADAALRFGKGEPAPPLSPLGRGEIATLARAFDAMALEIRERQRIAVEAERMAAVGELAAGVAHEINNPVGIIRGYLRTMPVDELSAEVADELRIIDEEAEACQRIVEDLLAYARAPQLELRPIEMRALLLEVAERIDHSSGSSLVEVEAAAGEALADPVRIRQVVTNLLRNAREASPTNEPVMLLGEAAEDEYRIIVGDRGPGIPEELRADIFKPFRSSKSGGTGLGLAVSRALVEAHGGSLTVRDGRDGGAEMVVKLPTTSSSEEESI